MPTFTAIAFDRLLETRSSKPVDKPVYNPMPVPTSKPPNPKPVSTSKLERRHSASSAERKIQRPQMTPALYATPEATPLPDSPSSFSPSPYVIDHKRRGPRLIKSVSEAGVSSLDKSREDGKCNGIEKDGENHSSASKMDVAIRDADSMLVEDKNVNGVDVAAMGTCNVESKDIVHEVGNSSLSDDFKGKADSPKPKLLISVNMGSNRDFYDPQESLSHTSNTDGEDNGCTDHNSNLASSAGEFFDAWEELSSESDQQLSSSRDVEKELREIRLSLLMEIEKRKQAEEALTNLQSQWQRLRQELSLVGLTLPAHPTLDGEQLGVDPVDDLCQQVVLARFVSEAIGRGTAKAEAEKEMENQLEAKNFEITRLIDRLHYYEAVNHEMSQRNQEAVERTRRLRQIRKRRQKWIWGSVAAAISLGSAALFWSYYPVGKGSSSASNSQELEHSSEANI